MPKRCEILWLEVLQLLLQTNRLTDLAEDGNEIFPNTQMTEASMLHI